ncbi:MAG TPA: DEAD/DEAH box helicase family protein [Egibacteraceae bacterium]|jgi:superfamily II DNA or RNA helicase|nr:DEAD/DEAH box helicase family protein [Egibacteraceae bacterium]
METVDPRRRFSAAERAALYLAAGGRCVECDVELDRGWHSDHVDPHSRGGITDVINGQALCPPCNLKKGNRVAYFDSFRPRPFQANVIEAVRDNHAAGKRVTVVLASPGSGKTITSQATACHMFRDGVIDYVVTLVPRITLAQQCELDWRSPVVSEPRRAIPEDWAGDFQLFDAAGRIEFIEHTRNRTPLLPPGSRGRGVVSTYSSLVTAHGQTAFESFARQHESRFLLVADEAQFCGEEGDRGGGTRAGEMVKLLHHYSAHTLLMTGTPYRSDNFPLILADYGDKNEHGLRPLLSDVESTYQDGVREGYLRTFEATFIDAKVRRREQATGTVTEYDLSRDGTDLRDVLRRADVWQPLADAVVSSVQDKQHQHPEHRGLISCMDMNEAKAVHRYLRATYPTLRASIATSDDDENARRALQAFKTDPADVLITVRMAFIGYDCKSISVVGVLTNYRDPGHLMQLVGRGLRTWDKTTFSEQSCRIIAPDDPKMQNFIKVMRQEMAEGLRERAEVTDRNESGGENNQRDEPLFVVDDAHATRVRAVSNDSELGHEQFGLVDSVARQLGITADRTALLSFFETLTKAGVQQEARGDSPAESMAGVHRPTGPVMTTDERIAALKTETSQIIKDTLSDRGIYAGSSNYGEYMKDFTFAVNDLAQCTSAGAVTEDDARRRRDAALELRGRPT